MSTKPNPIKVIYLPIAEIKPYWKNPRINDATVDALIEAIPLIGFNQPILIDKHNVIVKGHARYTAAVRLQMKKVPCIVSDNPDEINKLDRIADNKVFELSYWDANAKPLEIDEIAGKKKSAKMQAIKYTVICPYCQETVEVIL